MTIPPDPLVFELEARQTLAQLVQDRIDQQQQIFVLTDENTHRYCLPLLAQIIGKQQIPWHVMTIPAGEPFKTIETATKIWQQLTDHAAGRDALLINLGGGVVTDLGGFVASCYKRGISTIHVPTTLLGMIDAAIGGKTGVDFGAYKNHIGAFYQPEKVMIISDFLQTLDQDQMRSGYGELLKYGFIRDADLLRIQLPALITGGQLGAYIRKAALIKMKIVEDDPTEKGQRKILNFGHTLGHAFESFSWQTKKLLLHGEAVAAGIIPALWLSVSKCGLDTQVLERYIELYRAHFESFAIGEGDHERLLHLLQHDKKNRGGQLRFVLLEEMGKPVFDVEVEPELVKACLSWYEKNISSL